MRQRVRGNRHPGAEHAPREEHTNAVDPEPAQQVERGRRIGEKLVIGLEDRLERHRPGLRDGAGWSGGSATAPAEECCQQHKERAEDRRADSQEMRAQAGHRKRP